MDTERPGAVGLARFGFLPLRVAPGRANIVVWSCAVVAAVAQLSNSAAISAAGYGVPVPGALLLALVQAAAIILALFAPFWATALALLAGTGLSGLGDPHAGLPWPVGVPTMVAYCLVWVLVAQRSRWWVPLGGWGFAVFFALMVAAEEGAAANAGAVVADLVVFAGVSLGAVLLGLVIRNWALVRSELRTERALNAVELARREAVEEKARIARELHDVVAHGMSAIQVRAASARYRLPDLPEEAVAEFDAVAATARGAMREMRVILGVLRDEHDDSEHAPQPGLADIPALLDRARDLAPVAETGAWDLTDAERADPLLGLTAYRVVQEGLSNAARHAPGAQTEIAWNADRGELGILIRNGAPARASAPRAERGGQGLRGMRERLHAMGGSVDASPTDDGGFALHVRMPREETP